MDAKIKVDNSYFLIAIYLIIKKYGNSREPLSVQDISAHLKTTFLLEKKVDNRTIKEHINRIVDLHERYGLADELLCTTDEKGVSRYYFVEIFEELTLRLLTDIIASSKYIDRAYSKDLIETLYSINGQHMPSFYNESLRQKHLMMKPNPEVFGSVELIAKAIEENKKIRCEYLKFNHEHKLVRRNMNPVRDICVYEVIWTSDFYYALCRFDDSGKVYFLRIDKMQNVEILDEDLPPLPVDFDSKRYVSTQPHLFGGETQRISFHIEAGLLDQVVDSFGTSAIIRKYGNTYKIELDSSIQMMHVWILQYSPYISNIYPEKLKNKVVESLEQAIRNITKEEVPQ